MSEARFSAFLLILVICVLITSLSLEVNAVPLLVSCQTSLESSSLDEAIDVMKEDLKDVKSLLGSNQQQKNESCVSRKDLEDLKAVFASNHQQRNASSCESSTLNEAVNLIRDVKNLLGSNEQQKNATGISRKHLEDLIAACASNQTQNTSSISREDLEDLKSACASNQQQCPPMEPSRSDQDFISSFICEYNNHVLRFWCADTSQGFVWYGCDCCNGVDCLVWFSIIRFRFFNHTNWAFITVNMAKYWGY